MNTTPAPNAAETAKQTCGALLATLAGLGSTWAAYGLKVGKMALEQSADALGKTANTLDTLAAQLDKKTAPPPQPDVLVDASAPHVGSNDAAPAA